ncbi:DUF445 domain-containing protein [Gorillibacterium timonense]|uniref:DUF445 domain-containing protein n=1 Tax=Gorillibacterium timonense TaxID=1689269 RepID=UPI00071E3EEB|nr:DUF445 domain-containing protein [Gorillibacterium timonense]
MAIRTKRKAAASYDSRSREAAEAAQAPKSNTRKMATVSLLVMGGGFVGSLFLPETPFFRILSGGFEAGLVGGLADWFAVTALFRHPMGIPIPHTSLLLKNRNRIIESLIGAMETELLNKESIQRKLTEVRLLPLAASGIVKQAGKRSSRVAAVQGAAAIVRAIPLDKTAAVIQNGLSSTLTKADIQPLLVRLAEAGIREGWDERALDAVLRAGGEWVERPETEALLGQMAHAKLRELQVGGFMGFAFQAAAGFLSPDKLGNMLKGMLRSALWDMQASSAPMRLRLLEEIRSHAFTAVNDSALTEQLRSWGLGKLEEEATESWLLERLEELRSQLLNRLDEEARLGGKKVVPLLRYVLEKLRAMPETTDKWERQLADALVTLVERNHYRIGNLVRDNLNKLDDKALVEMLEEKIGTDLQWIRLNGAICGFLVGLVLTLFRL